MMNQARDELRVGYALSSEEHPARDLVRYAGLAEAAGFDFAAISDRYHPWTDRQGQSPFVWAVIGGIAATTSRLTLGTAVTCPTIRLHPAIIAQAAATASQLMPGRFFLGVGSGENLNEHIFGDKWPPIDVRLDMLEEAVDIIRLLWRGERSSYYGDYYTVENAQVYSLPDPPPPIYIAATGGRSAELAGRMGDGLIGTAPQRKVIEEFERGDGTMRKPRIGQIALCWGPSEQDARRTAHEWSPTAALPSVLNPELSTTAQFAEAARSVTEDEVAKRIVCGPNLDQVLGRVRAYVEAGFDHIYFHQIGPDQEGFLRVSEAELLPRVRKEVRGLGRSERELDMSGRAR